MRVLALTVFVCMLAANASAQNSSPLQLTAAWQNAAANITVAGSHIFTTATRNRQGVVEVNPQDGTLGANAIPLWPLPGASLGDLVVGISVGGQSIAAYDMARQRVRFEVRCTTATNGSCHVSAAVADASRVYFMGMPPGGAIDEVVIFALDAASGREAWRAPLNRNASDGAELALANGRLVSMQAHQRVRAFDAARGTLLWSRDLPHGNALGVFGRGLVMNDELVAFAEASGLIHVARTSSGQDVFTSQRTDGINDIMLSGEGLLVMSWNAENGDSIVALNTRTGREAFRFRQQGKWLSRPMVQTSDALYVRAASSATDANNSEGDSLLALDVRTGRVLWTRAVVSRELAALSASSPLVLTSGRPGTVAFARGAAQATRLVHIRGTVCTAYNIARDQFVVHVGTLSAPVARDGSFQIDARVQGSANIEVSGVGGDSSVLYTVERSSVQLVPGQDTYTVRLTCEEHFVD